MIEYLTTMTTIPIWGIWLLFILNVVCLLASGWFDRYSKARLKEAMGYWRRSKALWDAIDAVPESQIREEGLRAMEAFINEEHDQTGSIPTDYVKKHT